MARVVITMPNEFLDKIDQIAVDEQRSRSELIREALRTYINQIRFRMRDLKYDTKNAQVLESLM